MIVWKLETRNIKDLKKHPKNPRRLSKDQFRHIKHSMDKFGLIDKPIVNLDNTIIGGHQRIEVLKKDKVKEVQCWVPTSLIDDKDVEELLIRLNRNSGTWDWDLLANVWEVPELMEYGFQAEEMFEELSDEKPKKEKKKKECPHCGEEI